MISSGTANLPLHMGRAPKFLTQRMGRLSIAIIEAIIQEHGKSELLTRLADPNFFQSLAAMTGFQYSSSGSTATLLGSLRREVNARSNELGIHILGGKGRRGFSAPKQIERIAEQTGVDGQELIRSCRLANRVDSNCVQDGMRLYQSWFICSDENEWVAINQGLNTDDRRARRYHWRSKNVRSFLDDPHVGIVGEKSDQPIVNLADSRAENNRQNIIAMVQDSPKEIVDACRHIDFGDYQEVRKEDVNLTRLGAVLAVAQENGIDDFPDLVLLKGVGSKTLRSLALASELIHSDSPARFSDPARFSFGIGGKDSNPFPLDLKAYDETIEHLQEAVENSKLGFADKSKTLKKLFKVAQSIERTQAPEADLDALVEAEWERAEKEGGHTWMGRVIPGLSRAIFSFQNAALYGKRAIQKRK